MIKTSVTVLVATAVIASAGHAQSAPARHQNGTRETGAAVSRARAGHAATRIDARLSRGRSNPWLWAGPDVPAAGSIGGDASLVHDQARIERVLA